MMVQPCQHMMAVLPDGLGDDQTRFRVDIHKYIHSHALAGDESVFFYRIIGVSPSDGNALLSKGCCDLFFHRFLRGPAYLIGRKA